MGTVLHTRVNRFLGLGAGVLFGAHTLGAYEIEKNFWVERHRVARSARYAALSRPGGAGQAGSALSSQFPAVHTVRPSLSPSLARSLPSQFLQSHETLLTSLSPVHGTVRKVVLGGAEGQGRLVIHIQDVHQNSEAQWNLRGAVSGLLKSGRVGVVALEGSTDPIDLQAFVDFPYRKAVESVADLFLKENRISGPIHAALTANGKLPRIVGIDDPVHYEANVRAVRDSAPKWEDARKAVNQLQSEIEREKNRVYSPPLLALDRMVTDYRTEKKPLGDYVETLAKIKYPSAFLFRKDGKTSAIDLNGNVSDRGGEGVVGEFLLALNAERRLDFTKVETERTRLIETLTRVLLPEEINTLMAESLAYRAGQQRFADFYSGLKDLCRKKGIRLSDFPAMDSYIRYVLRVDRIEPETLLKEIALMEKYAFSKLARSMEEKVLVERSRLSWLAGRLVDFALTPTEWEEWAASGRELAGISRGSQDDRQKSLIQNFSAPPTGTAELNEGLGLDLSTFESFYREAQARDGAMAENVWESLNAGDVGVLVAGGFHAEGVSRQLARRGVTVVSYVPKIEKIDTTQGSSYLSVFTQEKTPLEKLFRGEKLFLSANAIPPAERKIALPVAVSLAAMFSIGSVSGFDFPSFYETLGGIGAIEDTMLTSVSAQAVVAIGAGAFLFQYVSNNGTAILQSSPFSRQTRWLSAFKNWLGELTKAAVIEEVWGVVKKGEPFTLLSGFFKTFQGRLPSVVLGIFAPIVVAMPIFWLIGGPALLVVAAGQIVFLADHGKMSKRQFAARFMGILFLNGVAFVGPLIWGGWGVGAIPETLDQFISMFGQRVALVVAAHTAWNVVAEFGRWAGVWRQDYRLTSPPDQSSGIIHIVSSTDLKNLKETLNEKREEALQAGKQIKVVFERDSLVNKAIALAVLERQNEREYWMDVLFEPHMEQWEEAFRDLEYVFGVASENDGASNQNSDRSPDSVSTKNNPKVTDLTKYSFLSQLTPPGAIDEEVDDNFLNRAHETVSAWTSQNRIPLIYEPIDLIAQRAVLQRYWIEHVDPLYTQVRAHFGLSKKFPVEKFIGETLLPYEGLNFAKGVFLRDIRLREMLRTFLSDADRMYVVVGDTARLSRILADLSGSRISERDLLLTMNYRPNKNNFEQLTSLSRIWLEFKFGVPQSDFLNDVGEVQRLLASQVRGQIALGDAAVRSFLIRWLLSKFKEPPSDADQVKVGNILIPVPSEKIFEFARQIWDSDPAVETHFWTQMEDKNPLGARWLAAKVGRSESGISPASLLHRVARLFSAIFGRKEGNGIALWLDRHIVSIGLAGLTLEIPLLLYGAVFFNPWALGIVLGGLVGLHGILQLWESNVRGESTDFKSNAFYFLIPAVMLLPYLLFPFLDIQTIGDLWGVPAFHLLVDGLLFLKLIPHWKIRFWDPLREQSNYYLRWVIVVPYIISLFGTTLFSGNVFMFLSLFAFFGSVSLIVMVPIFLDEEHASYISPMRRDLFGVALLIGGWTMGTFMFNHALLSPLGLNLIVETEHFIPFIPFLAVLRGKKRPPAPAFSRAQLSIPKDLDRDQLLEKYSQWAEEHLTGGRVNRNQLDKLVNQIETLNRRFYLANKELLADRGRLSNNPLLVKYIIDVSIFFPLAAINLAVRAGDRGIEINPLSWKGFLYLGEELWLVESMSKGGFANADVQAYQRVGLMPVVDYLKLGMSILEAVTKKDASTFTSTEKQSMAQALEEYTRGILLQLLKDKSFARLVSTPGDYNPMPNTHEISRTIIRQATETSWERFDPVAPLFVSARWSGLESALTYLQSRNEHLLGIIFFSSVIRKAINEKSVNNDRQAALRFMTEKYISPGLDAMLEFQKKQDQKMALQTAITLLKSAEDHLFSTFEDRFNRVFFKNPGTWDQEVLPVRNPSPNLSIIPDRWQREKPVAPGQATAEDDSTVSPNVEVFVPEHPSSEISSNLETGDMDFGDDIFSDIKPDDVDSLIGKISSLRANPPAEAKEGNGEDTVEPTILGFQEKLWELIRGSDIPVRALRDSARALDLSNEEIMFLRKYFDVQKTGQLPSYEILAEGLSEAEEEALVNAHDQLVNRLGDWNLLPVAFLENEGEEVTEDSSQGDLSEFYGRGLRVLVYEGSFKSSVENNSLAQKAIRNAVKTISQRLEATEDGRNMLVTKSRGGLHALGVHNFWSNKHNVFVKLVGNNVVVLWVAPLTESHQARSMKAKKTVGLAIAARAKNLSDESSKYVLLNADFTRDEESNQDIFNEGVDSNGGRATGFLAVGIARTAAWVSWGIWGRWRQGETREGFVAAFVERFSGAAENVTNNLLVGSLVGGAASGQFGIPAWMVGGLSGLALSPPALAAVLAVLIGVSWIALILVSHVFLKDFVQTNTGAVPNIKKVFRLVPSFLLPLTLSLLLPGLMEVSSVLEALIVSLFPGIILLPFVDNQHKRINSESEGETAAKNFIIQFANVQSAFKLLSPGTPSGLVSVMDGRETISNDPVDMTLARVKTDKEFRAGFLSQIKYSLRSQKLTAGQAHLLMGLLSVASGEPLGHVHFSESIQDVQRFKELVQRIQAAGPLETIHFALVAPQQVSAEISLSARDRVEESTEQDIDLLSKGGDQSPQNSQLEQQIKILKNLGVAVFHPAQGTEWAADTLRQIDSEMGDWFKSVPGVVVATVGPSVKMTTDVVSQLDSRSRLRGALESALSLTDIIATYLRLIQAIATNA
jgi:hypothetical protein